MHESGHDRTRAHVFLLAAALALAACGGGKTAGPRSGPVAQVLLVTIDTLRADRLGSYGFAAAETPNLDALAESGVRADQAYSQVPMTLPSHVSMLTGKYPLSTGVRINGAVGLGPNIPTLAERFLHHGYRTGAFVAADPLHSSFGLDRGFETYDDDMQDENGVTRAERTADLVTDAALRWLEEPSDRPFFAWVHYYDPHRPYVPPPAFAGAASDYDGEIAFVDSQIGRLLQWLDGAGLRDRTLIVVVGDHGEGLGDHAENGHGLFVYNSTLRVPLILNHPTLLPEPRTIGSPVELVDLFPTIVELMNWDAGESATDGRSFAEACTAGSEPHGPVYGESEYARLGFGWAPLRFAIDGEWKYIDAPRPELYDWRNDPQERDNVLEEHREVASAMRDALDELESGLESTRPEASAEAPDPEVVERLRSLGYVATTLTPEDLDEDKPLRDPKDMIDVLEGYEESLLAFRRGEFQKAVDGLEPLSRRSPESDELFTLLGFALLRLGRSAEAQAALETSLAHNQDNRLRWWALGMALRNQNRLEDALECFEKALEVSPDYDQAHLEAATVLSQLGRLSEAEPHWRRCVELAPDSVPCLTNLGSIRLMSHHPADAVPLLRQALEHDPRNPHALQGLWQAQLASGDREGAIRTLERAREIFPDAAGFRCPLAWFRATSRDASAAERTQAVEWARACTRDEPSNPRSFDTLAAALAASGDFEQAVAAGARALEMASATGRDELSGPIASRLRLYEQGRPYVEP